MGIDVRAAHLDEIPDLHRRPEAEQIVEISDLRFVYLPPFERYGQVDPGHEQGRRVFVRLEIDLDPIEGRFGKSKGGQGRADLIADRHGEVVLAPLHLRHDQPVEPRIEAAALEDVAAKGRGLLLGPAVDLPPLGHVVPVEIVPTRALQFSIHIALVGNSGIIGILPPVPLVLGVELLGAIPLLDSGINGRKKGLSPRRVQGLRPARCRHDREQGHGDCDVFAVDHGKPPQ